MIKLLSNLLPNDPEVPTSDFLQRGATFESAYFPVQAGFHQARMSKT